MAFRASSSRLNTQRQQSGSIGSNIDDIQLAALPVQRRRPQQGRLKRAGSSGKLESKGHYEACGTVKLLVACAPTAEVKDLEQAFLAEVIALPTFVCAARQDHQQTKHFLVQGYDVVLAHDAQAVVESMKASPHPDLVLLSYTLSGLTGSQVNLRLVASLPR